MTIPDWLYDINPVWLALVATCFTWGVTALGAAMVFFFRTVNRRALDAMLGFAAGVMIAASFWSLLAPAIEMAQVNGNSGWFQAASGFLLGGLRQDPGPSTRFQCCYRSGVSQSRPQC